MTAGFIRSGPVSLSALKEGKPKRKPAGDKTVSKPKQQNIKISENKKFDKDKKIKKEKKSKNEDQLETAIEDVSWKVPLSRSSIQVGSLILGIISFICDSFLEIDLPNGIKARASSSEWRESGSRLWPFVQKHKDSQFPTENHLIDYLADKSPNLELGQFVSAVVTKVEKETSIIDVSLCPSLVNSGIDETSPLLKNQLLVGCVVNIQPKGLRFTPLISSGDSDNEDDNKTKKTRSKSLSDYEFFASADQTSAYHIGDIIYVVIDSIKSSNKIVLCKLTDMSHRFLPKSVAIETSSIMVGQLLECFVSDIKPNINNRKVSTNVSTDMIPISSSVSKTKYFVDDWILLKFGPHSLHQLVVSPRHVHSSIPKLNSETPLPSGWTPLFPFRTPEVSSKDKKTKQEDTPPQIVQIPSACPDIQLGQKCLARVVAVVPNGIIGLGGETSVLLYASSLPHIVHWNSNNSIDVKIGDVIENARIACPSAGSEGTVLFLPLTNKASSTSKKGKKNKKSNEKDTPAVSVDFQLREEGVQYKLCPTSSAVCTISKANMATAKDKSENDISHSSLGQIVSLRVLGVNRMDSRVFASNKTEILNSKLFSSDDVSAGQDVEVSVLGVRDGGLSVALSPYLKGWIPAHNLGDILTPKTLMKFKTGSRLSCRVFSVADGRIVLTNKKRLCNLPVEEIPTSPECLATGDKILAIVIRHMDTKLIGMSFNGLCCFLMWRDVLVFEQAHSDPSLSDKNNFLLLKNMDKYKVGAVLELFTFKPFQKGRGSSQSGFILTTLTSSTTLTSNSKKRKMTSDNLDDRNSPVKISRRASLTLYDDSKGASDVNLMSNDKTTSSGVSFIPKILNSDEDSDDESFDRNQRNSTPLPFSFDSENDTLQEIAQKALECFPVGSVHKVKVRAILERECAVACTIVGKLQCVVSGCEIGDLSLMKGFPLRTVTVGSHLKVKILGPCEQLKFDPLRLLEASMRLDLPAKNGPAIRSVSDLKLGVFVSGIITFSGLRSGVLLKAGNKLQLKIKIINLKDSELLVDEDVLKERYPAGRILHKIKIIRIKGDVAEGSEISSTPVVNSDSRAAAYDTLSIGQVLPAVVISAKEFGLFVEFEVKNVGEKIRALCHKTELYDSADEKNVSYEVGDDVLVKILRIDKEQQRISVGMKRSLFEGVEIPAEIEDSGSEKSDDENKNEIDGDDPDIMNLDDEDRLDDKDNDEDQDDKSESDDDSAIEMEDNEFKIQKNENVGKSSIGKLTIKEIDDSDEDNNNSEDEESENFSDSESEKNEKNKKKEKNLSRSKRRAAEIEKEQKMLKQEERLSKEEWKNNPETVDDFEKAILVDRNNSSLWTKYMAHYVHMNEIDSARKVIQRGLNLIDFSNEIDKQNLWIVLLNLESEFGTHDKLEATIKKALEYNPKNVIWNHLSHLYEKKMNFQSADNCFEKMIKNDNQDEKVWINYLTRLYSRSSNQKDSIPSDYDPEKSENILKGRSLFSRALKVLPKKIHPVISVLSARMEFQHGSAARGRTLFDTLLAQSPKRGDIWNVYFACEIKELKSNPKNKESLSACRRAFQAAAKVDFKPKAMSAIFSSWKQFEKDFGTPDGVNECQKMALAYIERKQNSV